jgi:TolB protein
MMGRMTRLIGSGSTSISIGPATGRFGEWPVAGAGLGDKSAHQVTQSQDEEDWFPHRSLDEKWLVFIALPKGTVGHDGHLMVKLQMISLPGDDLSLSPPRTLAEFFGGQGTINVNSWSPDSSKIGLASSEQ